MPNEFKQYPQTNHFMPPVLSDSQRQQRANVRNFMLMHSAEELFAELQICFVAEGRCPQEFRARCICELIAGLDD